MRLIFPKTSSAWETSVVLKHLKRKKRVEELTLKALTLKLVMLLGLLTAQRVQTLSVLNLDLVILDRDKVVLKVNALLKPGTHLDDIVLVHEVWIL